MYHSTSNREPENETLCNHICSNLDQLLTDYPNALIIVTGDFNPSSPGLKLKDLTHTNNLTQMVNFTTRDSGILDWFLTNRPDFFTLSQLPKIGQSDHYSVLARSSVASTKTNYIRKIKTRDMRDSVLRPFGRWMIEKNWSNVYNAETCEENSRLSWATYTKQLTYICLGGQLKYTIRTDPGLRGVKTPNTQTPERLYSIWKTFHYLQKTQEQSSVWDPLGKTTLLQA